MIISSIYRRIRIIKVRISKIQLYCKCHFFQIRFYHYSFSVNFRWPFHRDFLLGLGLNDVSKESITHICTNKGKGNAAIIVIGGAAESLEAYPGNAKLKLKNRKGFVKIARKTG